jgi:hypothetical protein
MTATGSSSTRRIDSRIIAAIIGAIIAGVFGLLGVWLGDLLASRGPEVESYDVVVWASEFPLGDTNIRVNDGDEVEIRVLSANQTSWNCAIGVTNAMGFAEDDLQPVTLLPSANICALIGQIEGGPYFVVGAYAKFVADVSGSVFLGANDVPPEKCAISDCFADNEGKQYVKITVTSRE